MIPITDRNNDYAHEVADRLKAAGLRVQVHDGSDRMQAKVRDAQLMKVPYMLVLGDQEQEQGQVNLRLRTGDRRGNMSLDEFLVMAQDVIKTKALI